MIASIRVFALVRKQIAVEGCLHGELNKVYASIQHIEQVENTKIDLLFCCGDFQIQNRTLGSMPAAELLSQLKPQYWFSSHLHFKFSAVRNKEDGWFCNKVPNS
ncbi:hypothetical protein ZIOFF_012112 [Zingiber officinale]|uniref:Lariat debranching enzyme n=1 Tax=Zingiber officinale TaxID=94328 RepID=A0A8J5LQI6_ZINOF|nr:hypothetical protein ZIOFF_012112 [Zingiber officinale]